MAWSRAAGTILDMCDRQLAGNGPSTSLRDHWLAPYAEAIAVTDSRVLALAMEDAWRNRRSIPGYREGWCCRLCRLDRPATAGDHHRGGRTAGAAGIVVKA